MHPILWIVDPSFAVRLTIALLHSLWQGLGIGALVILGNIDLRHASARWRYNLNVAAMGCMAACIPITFCLQEIPHSVGTTSVESQIDSVRDAAGAPSSPPHIVASNLQSQPGLEASRVEHEMRRSDVLLPRDGTSTFFASESTVLSSFAPWVASLYLLSVTLILGRLAQGVWGGHRLQQRSRLIGDQTLLHVVRQQSRRLGLWMVPRLAWCEQISVPIVVGILRPMILLPLVVASGLTPHQLQALLMHELAHIHRFDPLVNLFQRIVEALLFFHPVVWWVSRRISMERELAADDMVLAAGWDRPLYADALVRMAELSTALSRPEIASGAVILGASGASNSEFKRRVLRLLKDSDPPKFRPTLGSILLPLVVVLSLLTTSVIVQARPQREVQAPSIVPTASTNRTAGVSPVAISPLPQPETRQIAQIPDPVRTPEFTPQPETPAEQKESAEQARRQLQKRLDLDKVQYHRASQANRLLPGTISDDEVTRLRRNMETSEHLLLAAEGQPVEWGPPVNGLRARAVPVLTSMSEDAVDLTQRVVTFAKPEDVAFAVELENVSNTPIKLLDTRYGDGSGKSKGKSDSNWSGPLLFSIDLFNQDGKKIERPAVQVADLSFVLDLLLVTTLEPGGKHRFLLRPGKWFSVLRPQIRRGSLRAAVRYLGLPARAAAGIKEYHPTSPVLQAVAGDVVSPQVWFDVSQRTFVESTSPPDWGQPSNGLRAAVEFYPRQGTFSHGAKPDLKLLIQNVSQQSITFSSRVSLAGDLHATVETEKGQSVDVAMTDYTGHVLVSRVTLAPQQIMTYDAGNIGLALTKERADKFEGTTDLRLVAPAGRYTVRLSGYFGKKSVGLRDGKGRTLAPLDGDWEGQLTTGLSSLRVEDEVVECSIVDAVTALPVTGWTTTFLYVKPKSADAEEVKISEVMWIADDRTLGRFHFRIPDVILQRADREELEVKWGVQHPDYEPYLSTDRISLKRFFQDGPQAARAVLSTIKLTPKKKAARGD